MFSSHGGHLTYAMYHHGETLLSNNDFDKAQKLKHHVDLIQVNKGAKIRNRFNQVPHLTQDTYGKVTNSQLDTTNESQEVSPFPAGDHKAHKKKNFINLVIGQ